MTDLKFHPLADIFPMFGGDEFGALTEDIRAHGLREPIVLHEGMILDGRNRYRACLAAGVEPRSTEYDGDDPIAFVWSLNATRRHLTPSQIGACALDVEARYAEEARKRQGIRTDLGEIFPQSDAGRAKDKAAAVTGANPHYITDAKAIRKADPERFEKVKAGKLSIPRAKKEIRAEQDRAALVEAQAAVSDAKRSSIESVCDIRVCSCADLFKSSIRPDAVITDPPYPAEFLPVFTELAEGCKAVGVPLVAVMSGQSYLPEVMRRLCEHLRYRWTLAYMTPGGQAVQQWPAKVNTTWKPVILFGEAAEWFGDVATSKVNDNDKRFHGWGQSESGMADLVERLTKPGQLVCDPFVGGGTTAVVCLALGRRFVGCDVDQEHVNQAKARVMA